VSNTELNQLARLAREGKLAKLDPKERAVVALRLGWDRPEGGYRSQVEVAGILGWTQAYVSQLESRARKALDERARALPPGQHWWENPDEVWSMGSWLVENFHITDCDNLLYYFEKPYKWDEEYTEYLAEREAERVKERA
jgi:hypothetical protein